MNLPQHAAETPRMGGTDSPISSRSFMDFNEGEIYDGIGRRVQELIMKTESFIVFIDEFGGVQWGYDVVPVAPDDYNSVTNRVAELEIRSRFLRIDSPLPQGVDIATHQHPIFSARRLIAEAVARLLDTGSVKAAHGMLDIAEKWIQQRSQSCSRQWLLVPFLIWALVGMGGFFLFVAAEGTLPAASSPWLLVLGGLLGGTGALVSSVLFNRSIPFDATAGVDLHHLEARLRWTVGFVAGLSAQLLVQGNVAMGFLGDNSSPVAALFISLLAGSSELFFPTLLRRFDSGLQPEAQE